MEENKDIVEVASFESKYEEIKKKYDFLKERYENLYEAYTDGNNRLLYKAICAMQSELPVVPKNKRGYNYRYSDLKTVIEVSRPVLVKHKLSVVQFFRPKDGSTYLVTRLAHISGQYIESEIAVGVGQLEKGKNPMQALGTSITYLRRYSYASIIGIVSDEDTDGV